MFLKNRNIISKIRSKVTDYAALTFTKVATSKEMLKTFANSLDPNQDRQNVGPDLDPNRLIL